LLRTLKMKQPDRISSKLLKYIIELVADPLVYIFNKSIQQCIFPDSLKLAVIKPIYKAGDKKMSIIISILYPCLIIL